MTNEAMHDEIVGNEAEGMMSIRQEEFSRIMQESARYQQENRALKEIIVRMCAERYFPKGEQE